MAWMAYSSPFRQARHARIAGFLLYAAFAVGDLYVVVSHFHSMTALQWAIAAIWMLGALVWMRLMGQSLRADDDE